MDIGVKVKTVGNMIINDREQIPLLKTAGVYRIPTMQNENQEEAKQKAKYTK